MRKVNSILCFFLCYSSFLMSQSLILDGYAYETGNRGYLYSVKVEIYDSNKNIIDAAFTDNTGHFQIEVPLKPQYHLKVKKDMFETLEMDLDCSERKEGEKVFVSLKLKRAPGYQFEITLAEKRKDASVPVDAIRGARIDVYNNTEQKEVFVLYDHPDPVFNVALLKNNHYTILIRKNGFLNKRLEAFVNVEGCILCFEGIGDVRPGVSDNLSEGNQMGVLLANVELDRLFTGKTLQLNNILYDLGKANLKRDDREGLRKLALLMSDNPNITVEIGSHTDSQGGDELNLNLSQKRAANVVKYLIDNGIDEKRLFAKGYGETQLLNECTNGVYCTDEKHRKNRRTELKILGISDSGVPLKSLAEIKLMEQGEKMLEEIQFGGQVQLPSENSGDSTMVSNDGGVDFDVLDSLALEVKDMPQQEVSNGELSNDEMTTEVLDTVEEQAAGLESANQMKESMPIEKEIEKPSSIKEQNLEQGLMQVEDSVVVSNPYSIVIHESNEALALESDLFVRHANLKVMQNNSGRYFYYIGAFENEAKARLFYKSSAKLAYPDAYLIKLEINGFSKLD